MKICKNCKYREDTEVKTMTSIDAVTICDIDCSYIEDIETETCNLFEEDVEMKKNIKVVMTRELESEGVILADKMYEIEVDGEIVMDSRIGFYFTQQQAELAQEDNVGSNYGLGVDVVTEGYYTSDMARDGAIYYRKENEQELITELENIYK